ncbi:MAG TPA: PAS domain S-box protein, partial [Bryobacteraceae bacterium]|nr:PAS domain S-box protein [Bryobacteraceae bacterium]
MNSSDAEIRALRDRVRELEDELDRVAAPHLTSDMHNLRAHLAAIVESSDDAIISKDLNGIIRTWNRGAERMFGYTADEVIGKPVSILAVPERANEMPDILARIRRGELIHHYETTRVTKNGRILTLSLTVSPIRDAAGTITGASKIARDITERSLAEADRHQLERQLMLLVEASGTLLASPDSEAVLHRILATAEQFVTADAYAVWRRQSSDGIWKLVISKGLSDKFERVAAEHGRRPGLSLPSEPFAVEDVESFPLLQERVQFYRAEGIRSMLNIPLRIHGEVGGTLVFYDREPHRFTESEIRLGTALGNLAAAAVGTAELYERQVELRSEAERAQREASFLADAGAILSSSLDYTATLAHVAESAVPVFADWCAVDVVGEDGQLQRVALGHQDPEKVAFAREFRRKYPPRDTDPALTALRTKQPVLIQDVSRELVVQNARNDEHLKDILALGITSFIVVPLLSHDHALGVLMFVTAQAGRRYTSADLAFAQQLAARAATAIENAKLHASVRDSEERLRLAQSAAGIGIWDWNIVTDDVTWSPEIYDLLGVEAGTIQPTVAVWAELIYPEDRDRALAEARRAIETGEPLETEFRIVRPDKGVRWLLSRGRVFRDGTGRPVRLLGLNMDVTAQKDAEQRTAFLLNLDDSLRRLDDPAAITATAARLLVEYLDVNRCAYADVDEDQSTFNLTGDYSRGVPSIVGRYTIEQFGREFAELCLRGSPYVVEDTENDPATADVLELYRLTQIRAAISVPLHKAGRFVAGMGVHQTTPRKWRPDDVEVVQQVANRCWESIERARIARGLRESEARFRQLANAIPALVWVTDAAGQILYFNDRWYAYTGLTAEQSLGAGWVRTLPPQDVERTLPLWQHALRSGEPYEVECRYRSAS